MKILSKLLLFIFLLTFSAPTIISLLEFEENVTLNIIEENEKSKEQKDFKTEFLFCELGTNFIYNSYTSKAIVSDYLINNYNTYATIDIIPPKD